ncbi:MAG: phage tail sheath family protein, partial [Bacteroidia bacterium]
MLHSTLLTALFNMKPIYLSLFLALCFSLTFGQGSVGTPTSQGIAQVETAIPAIIGYTQNSPSSNRPALIKSFAEYQRQFGKSTNGYYLYESVQLFFQNGGEKCYVISVGTTNKPILKQTLLQGLSISKKMSVQLILIPDAVGLTENDFYAVQRSMVNICALMKDRFAILNTLSPSNQASQDFQTFRSHTSASDLSYGAAYYPWVVTTAKVSVPPSGAIAGIYASKDRNQGVWKAPANVQVKGISSLSHSLSTASRNAATTHPSGKSINPIVSMPSKGILVLGARTLAGNDNEWRYVPVRRFAIMLEQSLEKGLTWAVFEPNDANTWASVQAFCEAYLEKLYREGALQGA